MSSRPQPTRIVPPLVRIEAQYRRFLARRWFSLMWRAAVWQGLVTGLSTSFIIGRLSAFPLGFILGLLAFPVTLYPVLRVQGSLLRDPPKTLLRTESRPFSLFPSSLRSPAALRMLGSYILYALGFTFVYCQVIQWNQPSKSLGVFNPTQRHPLHLNERFIFLLFGHAVFYVYLASRDTLNDSIKPIWPTKKVPLHAAAQNALSEAVASLGLGLLNGNGLIVQLNGLGLGYSFTYFMFRRSVWTFLYTHSRGLLKPFIINFVRSNHVSVTWSMVIHLQFLAFSSLLAMKAITSMLNIYTTQPIDFTVFSQKSPLSPDRYLLTALDSSNRYYLHFTLMELLRVSHDRARRKTIFGDISKTPVLTHELWQALLLHLGNANQFLTSRGGMGSATTATVASAATRAVPDAHSIALKSGDIFRPVVKQRSPYISALERVLNGPSQGPGSLNQAMLTAEAKAKEVEQRAVAQVANTTKQVVGRIEGTQRGGQVMVDVKARIEDAKGRVGGVVDDTRARTDGVVRDARGWLDVINDWAGKEWATRQVDGSLPDPIIISWIVDILATLAVASADEDLYGHVQQVLPATMEAVVRIRSSLIAFEQETVSRASMVGRGEEVAVSGVRAVISPASQTCENGIRRIAERFGTSLSVFRFPPAIATALSDITRPHQDDEVSPGG